MMTVTETIKQLLIDVLELGTHGQQLERDSHLLGSLPEFDSVAVISVITALEERFDIVVDDEDISAEVFETLGTLSDFVQTKLAS